MLGDALAQYLVWKRWHAGSWCAGPSPTIRRFAEAMRRAAKRFGAKIVEERPFKYEVGSRRADGGHEQVQEQIPALTRSAPPMTCWWLPMKAAYSANIFHTAPGTRGPSPGRRAWCRPAGTRRWSSGARPSSRTAFDGLPIAPCAHSTMMPGSQFARSARRRRAADPQSPAHLIAYLKSADFDLAAFKGRKLTYRAWDGQLRQPILLATAKLPVTVSPQPGLPAPVHRARYARHRQAGDQLPGLCAIESDSRHRAECNEASKAGPRERGDIARIKPEERCMRNISERRHLVALRWRDGCSPRRRQAPIPFTSQTRRTIPSP